MLKHLFTIILSLLSVSCGWSLTFHYSPLSNTLDYSISVINWAKLRQELINRYGENWYIDNIYKPGGFISICFSYQSHKDEGRAGLFISHSEYCDSSVIYSIKNSIITLSCKGETFHTDLLLENIPLDRKFESDTQYRDSILNDALMDNCMRSINLLIETGPYQFYYGNIKPTEQIKWAIGINRISASELFFVTPIKEEYIRECQRRNIDAILYRDDLTDCSPDRLKLLFEYVKANDNYLIKSSCTGPTYPLDFEYVDMNENNSHHSSFIRPLCE